MANRKPQTLILASLVSFFIYPQITQAQGSSTCRADYFTSSDFSQHRLGNTNSSSISRSVNNILQTSFDFFNKLDHLTFGLTSSLPLSYFLGQAHTLEDIKPNQWNQAELIGRVVMYNQPAILTPLKAARVEISFENKKDTILTGANGEFSGHYYKWIPYERIRLLPLVYERKQKLVKTISVPITIKIQTRFCSGELVLNKIPTDPITIILLADSQ